MNTHYFRKLPALTLLLLVVLLGACGEVPEGTIIQGCEPKGAMRAVCGMQSPEDIAVVPGGDYLLLSELGSMGERPGRVLTFNVNDEKWAPAYPAATAISKVAASSVQGDAACTTPPTKAMSPHGSHLVTLADGSVRYLLVNHGGREAVELFNVLHDGEATTTPALEWVGCVMPAANTIINDVVGLSNGDVIFTRMFKPDDFMSQVRGALFKAQTGDVWRWNKEAGLRVLPNTEGSLTNGIEIDAAERHVFINQYMDQEVHKYDLETEQIAGVANVANADNSAWGPNGDLWLATHAMDIPSMRACYEDHLRACGMEYDIIALNPETMEARSVFKHQGPPMGAATVARFNRDQVYIGSFLGDRLAIVPLTEFK